MVDYRAKGSSATHGERAEIGGRPAHRVRVTTRDGFARDPDHRRSARELAAPD